MTRAVNAGHHAQKVAFVSISPISTQPNLYRLIRLINIQPTNLTFFLPSKARTDGPSLFFYYHLQSQTINVAAHVEFIPNLYGASVKEAD